MTRVQDPSEDVVFRSTPSVVLAYAWYVLAAVAAIDLVVRADGRTTTVGLAVVAFLTAWTWALAHRPAVVATEDGVVLRNVVRDVFVPWRLLDHVEPEWSLVVVTTEGGSYPSWAVSAGSPRKRDQRALKRSTTNDDVPEHLRRKDTFGKVEMNLRWMHERAMHRIDPPPDQDVTVRLVRAVVALLAVMTIVLVVVIAL